MMRTPRLVSLRQKLIVGCGKSRFGGLREPQNVWLACSRRVSEAQRPPSGRCRHIAPGRGPCFPATGPAITREARVSKAKRRVLFGRPDFVFGCQLRVHVISNRGCHGGHLAPASSCPVRARIVTAYTG